LLAVVALVGVAQLRIDTATSGFLDREAPEWSAYERSVERHGTDELLVVALEYERAWLPRALSDVASLSASIEKIQGVRRVDSLATVPLIRMDADSLRTDSGLSDEIPSTPEAIDEYRLLVQRDRVANRSLVSDNGRVFAINVLLENDVSSDPAGIVEAVRLATTNLPAKISGVPVFRTAVNSRTRAELAMFVPATLLILACVVAAFVPRVALVATPLAVGGIAALTAVSAMGFLDVEMSLSTLVLPSVIAALGCAYAMHVVALPSSDGAISSVAEPIALSGVTTTLGFLAMSTVPISAIQDLSTFGALGVLVATGAALSLAPALRSAFPAERKDYSGLADLVTRRASTKIARLVVERDSAVLALWGVALLASAVGLSRLDISTDIILWFPEDGSIRRDYEEIRNELAGITPVNILIEPLHGSAPDMDSYAAVRAIDDLSEALTDHPSVGKSLSIADPLRLANRAFRDNDRSSLPRNDPEISQYLLLLSGMDRLDDVLHQDRRSANIALRLDNNSSDEIVTLSNWVADWWELNGDGRYQASTTGVMFEFARAEESITRGQAIGFAFASGLVAIILFAALGGRLLPAAAMAANLVPVAIGFGTLGFLGVPLDAATACLASMALGIAVDDSIHLASAYRESRGERGAIERALKRVLLALVMTTAAISAGFLILSMSEFTLVRNLGVVTAYVVTLCLLADVFLLPALLSRFSRHEHSEGDSQSPRA